MHDQAGASGQGQRHTGDQKHEGNRLADSRPPVTSPFGAQPAGVETIGYLHSGFLSVYRRSDQNRRTWVPVPDAKEGNKGWAVR